MGKSARREEELTYFCKAWVAVIGGHLAGQPVELCRLGVDQLHPEVTRVFDGRHVDFEVVTVHWPRSLAVGRSLIYDYHQEVIE